MTPLAVLTADVVASTSYDSEERRVLNQSLLDAFNELERRFPHAWAAGFSLRITAGDEFQGVIGQVAEVYRILVCLRAELALTALKRVPQLRAGVGLGAVTVADGLTSWEQDGPAFLRARRALTSLGRSRRDWRRTAILTGEAWRDESLAALLGLCDHIQRRWTRPQWEAVRPTVLGATSEEVARTLNIARQNVTKRLQAAGWSCFKVAVEHISSSLEQAASKTQ